MLATELFKFLFGVHGKEEADREVAVWKPVLFYSANSKHCVMHSVPFSLAQPVLLDVKDRMPLPVVDDEKQLVVSQALPVRYEVVLHSHGSDLFF